MNEPLSEAAHREALWALDRAVTSPDEETAIRRLLYGTCTDCGEDAAADANGRCFNCDLPF